MIYQSKLLVIFFFISTQIINAQNSEKDLILDIQKQIVCFEKKQIKKAKKKIKIYNKLNKITHIDTLDYLVIPNVEEDNFLENTDSWTITPPYISFLNGKKLFSNEIFVYSDTVLYGTINMYYSKMRYSTNYNKQKYNLFKQLLKLKGNTIFRTFNTFDNIYFYIEKKNIKVLVYEKEIIKDEIVSKNFKTYNASKYLKKNIKKHYVFCHNRE